MITSSCKFILCEVFLVSLLWCAFFQMHSVKPQVLKFLLKLVEQNGMQPSSIASLHDGNLSRSCEDWIPGHKHLISAQHQSERKASSPERDIKMEVADDNDLNLAKLESEGLQIAKNGQCFLL